MLHWSTGRSGYMPEYLQTGMPLTVQCPTCRQLMKTAPKSVLSAVKRCVYCGKSFKIHTPGGESRIRVPRGLQAPNSPNL